MDDKRIGNGNVGLGAEFHHLDYHRTSHLPTKENQYEKNALGFGGFAQYAGEYQLGEYFHKTSFQAALRVRKLKDERGLVVPAAFCPEIKVQQTMTDRASQMGNADKRLALDVLVEETQLTDESRVTGKDTSHLGAYDEDRIRKAVNDCLCLPVYLHDGNLPNIISIPSRYFTL